jgi:Condensation domain
VEFHGFNQNKRLGGLDPAARDEEAARIAARDRSEPFDLTRAPLLRLGPDRHRLVLTTHHLLWDGWSVPVVLEELFLGYAGAGLSPVTPFRHYLRWLRGPGGLGPGGGRGLPDSGRPGGRRARAAAAAAPGHVRGVRRGPGGRRPPLSGHRQHAGAGGLGVSLWVLSSGEGELFAGLCW